MLSIVIMFICFSLLTGCESSPDIDILIHDYVKDKYNFNVDIISRESKNEGNMGDRTFTVQQTNPPNIKFNILLSGMLHSTVEGDNYRKQKEAYGYTQPFLSENKQTLHQLGFDQIVFSATADGLTVSALSKKPISLSDSSSIEHLLGFLMALNRYQAETLNDDETIESVLITHNQSKQSISIPNIHMITDQKALVDKLNQNPDIVNDFLFQRDYASFQALEKALNKISYQLKNGLTVGMIDESFYCYGKNIKDGECSGGYEIKLSGPKDAAHLFKAVELLKKQDINIKDIVIVGKPIIMLENIDDITSVQQIKLILK